MQKDQFLFGVNAGGNQFLDSSGNLYVKDTYGVGKKYSNAVEIAGTADDVLYQTETWKKGGFTYEIPVSDPGFYYVELNFAEIYPDASAAGYRVFDIKLEGALVADNFDIFAAAGSQYTAYTVGYFVEVTDGAMTLTTTSEQQNPKINAFSIWSVSTGEDATAPAVAIATSGGAAADEPLTVTVTYTDETALDAATIALNDLAVSSSGPAPQVISQDLVVAADGKTATATYQLLPTGGWTADPVTLSVAAGAIADAAGNANAAASAGFTFQEPQPDATAPTVAIATSGGATATDPLTVTVTYADETGLDAATIQLNDLSVSGSGPTPQVVSQNLVVASDGLTATATYQLLPSGGWTSDPVTLSVAAGAIADEAGNLNAAKSANFAFIPPTDPFSGIAPVDAVDPNANGAVRIEITPGAGVQASNYGTGSFTIENIGDKRIAAVYFDVADALFPDTVFDPVGLAGDSVSRGVFYSDTGGTGAVVYGHLKTNSDVLVPFYGEGGASGYEGMLLKYQPDVDGGFQTGELVKFGVDMDPNSIVGIPQNPVDIDGADPRFKSWDIGGVSGAELLGSTIRVLFTDGTQASGQLVSDGSQGGALTVLDQSVTPTEISLAVNGVDPGGTGTWGGGAGDSIVVEGPAGVKAQVTLAFGFAQPFDYVDPNGQPISVADRLAASGDPFGANNALEIQTVYVTLTGGPQDITSMFDLTPPGGTLAFAGDDMLPIGLVAVAVNGANEPIGPVTAPIHLAHEVAAPDDVTAPTVSIATSGGATATDPLIVTVTYADETGLDPATIELNDLSVSGSGPTPQVISQNLVVAADGLSATASYQLLPAGGWTADPVTLSVGAGAIADAAGNGNAAASKGFTYAGSSDATAPTVSITTAGGTAADDPLIVTVTYSDETGLDAATIALDDLTVSGAGPTPQVLAQNLVVASNGLTATATYQLLPTNGWTTDPLTLSIGAGAIADEAGNANAAASAGFTYQEPSAGANTLAEMTQLALQGVSLNNPTSIDVGADGRLYVSQQNGLLVALTIDKTVTNSNGVITTTWSVTGREDIDLVKNMPNHDDQGVFQASVGNRQVTGLVATTDANGNVMLYVTSSDPRIGGGGSGEDKNLDTNSGVLSRLTQVDDGNGGLTWEKVDLVRGLPRSEENHAVNGLQLATDPDGHEVLVVTIGGNTNTGAQSNNFAYTPEYYYSGAIVTVDLDLLDQMEQTQGLKTYDPSGSNPQTYLYDLPTLDDPTRTNDALGGDLAGDGSTTADVFGGNEGLNQAMADPLGIVKIIAAGFRNQYDVVITEDGAIYTVDNGSNTGWGGNPVNAQGQVVVDANGDGIADNGPALNLASEIGPENNADGLHRVVDDFSAPIGQVYYGGHPNLYRAYGGDAGFYLYASPGNPWGVANGTPLTIVDGALQPVADGVTPEDVGPLISNLADLTGLDGLDPRQAVLQDIGQRKSGLTDAPNGALYTWSASTNGLEEYTGSGDLHGKILAVSFDGKIYAIGIGADGEVSGVEERSLTSKPLDLVAQGDGDPYPGVIFVAAYGADQIVILQPDASVGVVPNPNDRDLDGIDDTIDPFAADPDNGMADAINPGDSLVWTFVNGESFPNERDTLFDGTAGLYNGGDIGFTGIMTNRGGLPETLYDQQNIIFGGAPGILQIKSVETGDAATETQRNGFQLGVTTGEGLESFTVRSSMDNYLDELAEIPAGEKLSQGVFIGAGDQNNFVSVSLVRLADGRVGFEVISQFAFDFIGETAPQVDFYEVPALATAGALDTIDIGFDVDVAAGTATPVWTYHLGATSTSGSGAAVALQGDALAALEGTLTLPDDSGGQVASGLAVGFVASRAASAAGGVVAAISAGGDETFTATIDGTDVTFVPDTSASNVSLFGSTKKYATSESFDVPNTALDELYTEERYGTNAQPWGYSIATGNGSFQVDLFFAEMYDAAFAVGARVFDITIEGVKVADNFDIFAAAGGGQLETTLTYTANVTDGTLDISFSKEVENAKVNGVLVRELGNGVFAADWDDLRIEGFGTTVPDTTAPAVDIALTEAATTDDPLIVTVTYSDARGLDPATIALSDLVATSSGAAPEILSEDLVVAADGLSATATYTIIPTGGWTADPLTLSVAAGAIADAAGNLNAAASVQYAYEPPQGDTTPPAVVIATAGGTATDDPITVTVTYSDETALDAATIALNDLSVTGSGPAPQVISQNLAVAADGLSATATYQLLPTGGWTADPVTLSVAAGAVSDEAGNANAAASASFTYQGTLPDTTAPTVDIASSGGATASDPLTVTVTYSDETALDPATIALNDLAVTGSGPAPQVISQNLAVAADGLSATATYELLPSGGWTADPVTLSVAAGAISDAAGNGNAAASAGFTFDANPVYDQFVFAVNSGGNAFTASDGTVYQKDTFGVGRKYSNDLPIDGTADDALYHSETWKKGGFTYDIPVENGRYRVEMHFAETFPDTSAPGARVFDVHLEDQLVFDNLDVFSEAGPATALVKEAYVDVTDGALTLWTTSEVENPKINAFSIWAEHDALV